VPLGFEFHAQFTEVVDLAVDDDVDGVILVRNWLATAINIDDSEPAHTEAESTIDELTAIVRTPVNHRVRHRCEESGIGGAAGSVVKDAANAAHRLEDGNTGPGAPQAVPACGSVSIRESCFLTTRIALESFRVEPPPKSRPLFLGLPLDPLTMDETVARCRELILAGRPAQHVVLNAGKCVLMEDEPDIREIVAACDLVNADGQSVVWAARFLGLRVPERVAGIDLMGRLLSLCEAEGWPVYFLGATDDVLEEFSRVASARHPKLRIAGRRNGYFQTEDEPTIVDAIRESGARLLLVGISSPMKERLLARHLNQLGPVLAMGVGGSFDVWAGKTTRAPAWMQRVGLEWFHRFAQEPRRMWRRYLVGNLRFAWIVFRAKISSD